jgi:hypothetical protein
VSCEIEGVAVDAELPEPGALDTHYRQRSGARPAARAGGPACAAGRPDERSWSRPADPTRPVGRYRCRIEGGRAAMWWTDERGVLAHALARDRDLARLFRWWRALPQVP